MGFERYLDGVKFGIIFGWPNKLTSGVELGERPAAVYWFLI